MKFNHQVFDLFDCLTDVMLLEEPWASEDKENKKPSEAVEEDACLIEDLPLICNEVCVPLYIRYIDMFCTCC